MIAPGRIAWAVNPGDPTKKRRPAVVLWVEGDRALVAFGQSFDSAPGTPAFSLDPNLGETFRDTRPTSTRPATT